MNNQTAAAPSTRPARYTGVAAKPSSTKQVIVAALPAGLVPRGVYAAAMAAYIPWGKDNRQPQRTLEAVGGSGTAAVCTDLKAKFIAGNGFTDLTFAGTVINRQGLTVDALLRKHAPDLSTLEGMAVTINFNGLGYPCEAFFAPLAQWRKARPDGDGVTRSGYILNNLTTDPKTTNSLTKTNAKRFRLFDPAEEPAARVERIIGEMAAEGKLFTDYPGELFVWIRERPGAGDYPRPTYDAVMRDVLTEAALKVSRHRDVRDGFAAQVMVTELGTAEPTEQKLKDDAEKYGEFVGEEGARFIVQYAVNKDSKPLVDTFTVNNSSDRYQVEEGSLKINIRATFQIPTILYGEEVAGKLGTADEYDDAVKYVQTIVVNGDQLAVEEFYSKLFGQFQPYGTLAKPGINPANDYSIKNLTLTPAAQVPTAGEKIINNLKSLSPLVQNQVLTVLTINEQRALIGLDKVEGGDVLSPTTAPPVTVTPDEAGLTNPDPRAKNA